MSTITIDGKRHGCLISCHTDNRFSYFQNGRWVTATHVPASVLNDPDLPIEEFRRVRGYLLALGRLPPGLTR